MKRFARGVSAAVLAVSLLGACSANAGIDATDNGVKVSGDVDPKN